MKHIHFLVMPAKAGNQVSLAFDMFWIPNCVRMTDRFIKKLSVLIYFITIASLFVFQVAYANPKKIREDFNCIDHLDDYVQRAPNAKYKELFVTACGISDKDTDKLITFLNQHQDIREVVLNGNPVGPELLKALSQKPNLIVIGLQQTQIGDEGAKIIATSPSITTLDLQSTDITPIGIRWLMANPTLTTLYLTYDNISDEGARLLSENSKLETLWLGDTNITDIGLGFFAHHPNLRNLNLSHEARISEAGIAAIASIPNLTEINLDDNAIGDAGIAALGNHPKLESISVIHCGISVSGLLALKNSTLNSIVLENNNLDDAAGEAIAKIPANKWDFIDLKNNKIGDASAINLSRLNKSTRKAMSALILSKNNISDAGAAALAIHPPIKRLELAENNIHDEGAIALSKKKLDVLDITYNHVGPAGIAALKNSQTIKYAYVDRNDGAISYP